jgi:DNA-binding transcriptional regulator YbjK
MYRRMRLTKPAFASLKKLATLRKLYEDVKEETEKKSLKSIMSFWVQNVLNKQLENQTQSHYI